MTRTEAIRKIQRALSVPNRLQGLVLIDEDSANMAIEALQWQDRILTQLEDIVLNGYGERSE